MNDDELIFAPEDDALDFAPESGEELLEKELNTYKILVVDDDEEVHSFTKIALKNFTYKDAGITFVTAKSAKEAKLVLEEHTDIAVALLDVVMETNQAGLDVAKFIRKDLGNELIRIIVRTGQPGEAPERFVIDNYDINDYKEKTELTADKLYTTIRTALAQYTQLVSLLDKKDEIYQLLITDTLTGLPNRIKLNYDLDSNNVHSLMLIDIDRFSLLNDSYGFTVGDKVLLHVRDLLNNLLKDGMELYRLEADIFAILLCDSDRELLEDEVDTVKTVIDTSPMELDELSIYINVSIGIVHSQLGNIIQKAEIALRQARKISHNRVEFYRQSLELLDDIEENSIWTARIARALEQNNILAYYQPIVDTKTGNIVKYEVLVRLKDEETIYSPFYFLKIARSAGYLHHITKKVFEAACKTFKGNNLKFSVNITDHDLSEAKFVEYLLNVSRIYEIEPERIVFEILEETSMSDNKLAKINIQKLVDVGFQLSIDDFGTECSNFAQLGQHQYESIKIDGVFIKDIDKNKTSQDITESILFFTKKVGFKTVAEFVHSQKIYDIVKSMGVDYAQGYFFGEPKPELIIE